MQEYKDNEGKLSIRAVAEKYYLDKSLLSRRLLGQVVQKRGRKTALDPVDERKLAENITDLAKWGFALTSKEVRQIVGEYVEINNIQHPFSKKSNTPGRDLVYKNCQAKQPNPPESRTIGIDTQNCNC